MNGLLKLVPPTFVVVLTLGCVTNSTVETDPPGLTVFVNNVEQGVSPCKIQSTGTTFGQYYLELKDTNGTVVFESPLPKNVRVWGIFWPPYGVFYNMYEFFPGYTIKQLRLEGGRTIWNVKTEMMPSSAALEQK